MTDSRKVNISSHTVLDNPRGLWFALYCRLNVHVLDSDRTVIRAAFRRMSKSAALHSKEAKQLRKDAYRELLKQHRDALELSLHVARGD